MKFGWRGWWFHEFCLMKFGFMDFFFIKKNQCLEQWTRLVKNEE
jgi:hypothetical protein